jgi:hypothetical protein
MTITGLVTSGYKLIKIRDLNSLVLFNQGFVSKAIFDELSITFYAQVPTFDNAVIVYWMQRNVANNRGSPIGFKQ